MIRKSHPAILQNGSLNDVIYSHSLPLSVSLHLSQSGHSIFILIDIVNHITYNKEKGGIQMATTPTQIRIDANIKQEASALDD